MTCREDFDIITNELLNSEGTFVIVKDEGKLEIYESGEDSLPKKIDKSFQTQPKMLEIMGSFDSTHELSIDCSGTMLKDRVIKFSIFDSTLVTKFILCYANPDDSVHKSGTGGGKIYDCSITIFKCWIDFLEYK
ncbi:MAG: hypothetical protein LBJ12_09615 [Oscillospiraceae bacterium]|nr:hypothetical protein [Oscillospiraceae bacterium]